MIIVSKPSAKATGPVRKGRSTLPRRRSSAAYDATPRYGNTWPISVHTEVLAAVSEVLTVVFVPRTSLGSSYAASLWKLQPGTTRGKRNYRARAFVSAVQRNGHLDVLPIIRMV
jgi:hypothetical protein